MGSIVRYVGMPNPKPGTDTLISETEIRPRAGILSKERIPSFVSFWRRSGFGIDTSGILHGNRFVRDHWSFLAGFLRRPLTVGAVAPSSACLARAVIRRCDLRTADTVVELGAGTGAITEQILARIGPRTRFIALELDSGHAALLARKFPGVIVCNESAEDLQAIIDRLGCGPVDCVISGRPWASMGPRKQERLMAEVLAVLKPTGQFCGFGYLHTKWAGSTQTFHRLLKGTFSSMHISPVVWRNLPPAFAFTCPLSVSKRGAN